MLTLCVAMLAGAGVARAVTLQEAVAAGQVRCAAQGSYTQPGQNLGQALMVSLENLTPNDLTVRVPVATVFVPDSPSYQRMAATEDKDIWVPGSDYAKDWPINAMCLDPNLDPPSPSAAYTAHHVAGGDTAQLLRHIATKRAHDDVISQTALWILADEQFREGFVAVRDSLDSYLRSHRAMTSIDQIGAMTLTAVTDSVGKVLSNAGLGMILPPSGGGVPVWVWVVLGLVVVLVAIGILVLVLVRSAMVRREQERRRLEEAARRRREEEERRRREEEERLRREQERKENKDKMRIEGKTVVVGGCRYPMLAQLVVRGGRQEGTPFPLYSAQKIVIGRDPVRCQIVIDDPAVSSEHAAVTYSEGKLQIYDLASRNGTFVNEHPVTKPVTLFDHDVIRVGETRMSFVKL